MSTAASARTRRSPLAREQLGQHQLRCPRACTAVNPPFGVFFAGLMRLGVGAHALLGAYDGVPANTGSLSCLLQRKRPIWVFFR